MTTKNIKLKTLSCKMTREVHEMEGELRKMPSNLFLFDALNQGTMTIRLDVRCYFNLSLNRQG